MSGNPGEGGRSTTKWVDGWLSSMDWPLRASCYHQNDLDGIYSASSGGSTRMLGHCHAVRDALSLESHCAVTLTVSFSELSSPAASSPVLAMRLGSPNMRGGSGIWLCLICQLSTRSSRIMIALIISSVHFTVVFVGWLMDPRRPVWRSCMRWPPGLPGDCRK